MPCIRAFVHMRSPYRRKPINAVEYTCSWAVASYGMRFLRYTRLKAQGKAKGRCVDHGSKTVVMVKAVCAYRRRGICRLACSLQAELILSDKFEPAALPDVAPRLRVVVPSTALRANAAYVGAPAGRKRRCRRFVAAEDEAAGGLDRPRPLRRRSSVFYKQLATGCIPSSAENEAMRAVLTSPSFSLSPVEHAISLIGEMRPPEVSVRTRARRSPLHR